MEAAQFTGFTLRDFSELKEQRHHFRGGLTGRTGLFIRLMWYDKSMRLEIENVLILNLFSIKKRCAETKNYKNATLFLTHDSNTSGLFKC